MSTVDIKLVTDKQIERDFLQVPFVAFAGDPNWVPPLFIERHDHLSRKKNPYFEHAEAALFVAYQDGKPVGRISAQVDQLHLQRHEDATGQFRFLDAIDDAAVFGALFYESENWVRAQGMKAIRGPFSFSINDETGLLVQGFETPPNMLMGHARPYYARHIEAHGYFKTKDVFTYEFSSTDKLERGLELAFKRSKNNGRIQVRPLSKKNLQRDLKIIMHVFNDAWSSNWGFVPFTEKELQILGNNLKILVSEEYVAIATLDGEPAAMAVTLPNMNEWINDLGGKLLPFGWAKLAYRLFMSKNQSVRLPLMGVLHKYQNSVTGSALALSVIDAVRTYHLQRGILRAELGWILEDNVRMRNMIESSGAKVNKVYRLYEKSV